MTIPFIKAIDTKPITISPSLARHCFQKKERILHGRELSIDSKCKLRAKRQIDSDRVSIYSRHSSQSYARSAREGKQYCYLRFKLIVDAFGRGRRNMVTDRTAYLLPRNQTVSEFFKVVLQVHSLLPAVAPPAAFVGVDIGYK